MVFLFFGALITFMDANTGVFGNGSLPKIELCHLLYFTFFTGNVFVLCGQSPGITGAKSGHADKVQARRNSTLARMQSPVCDIVITLLTYCRHGVAMQNNNKSSL